MPLVNFANDSPALLAVRAIPVSREDGRTPLMNIGLLFYHRYSDYVTYHQGYHLNEGKN